MVQIVNHVVNCRALLKLLVHNAAVALLLDPHQWTAVARADPLKLSDQSVQFQDKLPDMLINPDILVGAFRHFNDFSNVGGLVPN